VAKNKARVRRTADDHGGDYKRWQSGLRPPKKITVPHDDRHAKYVGRTKAGEQFFVTAPFVEPGYGVPPRFPRRDFVALYLFDKKGALLRAEIVDLGTRDKKDARATRAVTARAAAERDRLLGTLGAVKYGPIRVAPFLVRQFDTVFGLSHSAPEDPFEPWLASFCPGCYMQFTQPWDSGTYEPVYLVEPLF